MAVLFHSWRCFRLEVTSWKAPLRRAITMFNRIMKRLTSYSMKYMVANPGAMTFICSKSKSPSIIRISDSIDSWRLQKSIMRGPNVQYPQKPNPTIRIPLATKKTTRSFYSIRGEGRREKEERKMVNDEDEGGRMWKNRQKLLGYNRFLPTFPQFANYTTVHAIRTHLPLPSHSLQDGFILFILLSFSRSFFLSLPPCPSLSLLLPQCREVGCDRNTQYANHYVSRRDCGDISTYRRTVPRNCPQHGHKSYVGGGGYIY